MAISEGDGLVAGATVAVEDGVDAEIDVSAGVAGGSIGVFPGTAVADGEAGVLPALLQETAVDNTKAHAAK